MAASMDTPDRGLEAKRASTGARRSLRRRRLLVVLVSFVGSLVLAEVGMRLVLAVRGQSFDAERTRFELTRLRSAANDDVPRLDEAYVDAPGRIRVDAFSTDPEKSQEMPFLHPFFGWEIVGGAAMLESDLKWSRHPDYKQTYKILLVGGSVAMMFGHYGTQHLCQLLKKDPRFAGKRLYVHTFARGGYKEPQQLDVTNYLFSLGMEYQAVLCIDGFNEVALSNENVHRGANPIQPSMQHWGALTTGALMDRVALDDAAVARSAQRATTSLSTFALDAGAYHSALLSWFVLARLNHDAEVTRTAFEAFLRRAGEIGTQNVLRGPSFDPDPVHGIQAAVRAWEESSRSLRAICRERGIPFLHVLQPNLMDVRNRALTAEELEADRNGDTWAQGVHVGYPLLREAGRRLAAEGTSFVDASDLFDGESESPYFDRCHFRERGNELLAERIARAFLDSLPR